MIPFLPEFSAAKPTAPSESVGGVTETLPENRGGLPGGERLNFDALIAAANEPLPPSAELDLSAIEARDSAVFAPDLRVSPGRSLPISGTDLPEIELPLQAPAVIEPASVDAPSARASIPVDPSPLETARNRVRGPAPSDTASPTADERVIASQEPDSTPKVLASSLQDSKADGSDNEDRVSTGTGLAAANAIETESDPRLLERTALPAAASSAQHRRSDEPVAIKIGPVIAAKARAIGNNSEPVSDGKPRGQSVAEQAKVPAQAPLLQASGGTGADAAPPSQPQSPQSPQAQPAPALANLALSTAAGPLSPVSEVRAETRVIPQIEQAIDALTGAREAGRTSRPEVLLRHSEFGLVSMRLEAASGDLRANLASRDPAFIPAIHAALGDRAISGSSETATNFNQQRGQDQNQSGGTSPSFAGNNGGSGANYGSSPGSSQGSPQPRMGQQGSEHGGPDEHNRAATQQQPDSLAQSGGVFA